MRASPSRSASETVQGEVEWTGDQSIGSGLFNSDAMKPLCSMGDIPCPKEVRGGEARVGRIRRCGIGFGFARFDEAGGLSRLGTLPRTKWNLLHLSSCWR